MLPIKLSIEGLNSYSEKVEIDFQRFYERRLFGIFGDTGSGKSTILDAIFLALYGRIPRLGSQNLDRAINPSNSKIDITFSFQMSDKVYRVERTIYKSDRSSGSKPKEKLYMIGEREQVLADKKKEVDDKVEKIIGMRFDEFSKVVILPQNEFAELLKLGGAERSEIIGHLFDLNIYGEPLYNVVSGRLDRINKDREIMESKLKNLEDISEESIAEMEEKLIKAKTEREMLTQENAELNNKRNLYERIRDLNKKWEEKKKELKKIEEGLEEIEAMRERLKLDEEMTPVKESFNEWMKLKESISENMKRREQKERRLVEIAEEERRIEIEKGEFDSSYNEKKGVLSERLLDARKAMELMDEIERLKNSVKKEEENIKRFEREGDSLKRDIEKIDVEIRQIEGEIERVETSIKEMSLSEEEKKLYSVLPDVLKKKRDIEDREKSLKKENESLINKKKEYDSLLKRLSGRIVGIVGKSINSHDEAVELIVSKIDELESLKRGMNKKLEELRIADTAAGLSRLLREGEPCPVCGSREHPSPAKGERREEIERLSDEITDIDEQIRRLKDLREKEINQLNTQCITLSENIRQIKEKIDELKNDVERFRQELLSVFPEEFIDNAEQMDRNFKTRQEKREELEKDLKRLTQSRGEKKEILNEKRSKMTELSTRMEERRAGLERLRVDLDAKLDELNRKTGGKRPEDMKREAERGLEKNTEEIHLENIKKEIEKDQLRYSELENFLLKKATEKGVSIEDLRGFFLDKEERDRVAREIEDYERKKNILFGELKQIERQIDELPLKDLPEGEPERTYRMLAELGDRKGNLNREIGAMEERIEKGRKSLEEKSSLLKSLEEIRIESGRMDSLKKLIEGKGMVRYLSTCLMDKILGYSNEILEKIMGKRMALKVSSDLSFQVKDFQYNSTRDVKTLSGGEMFIISFALALSLSYYIQSRRGKEIKFFFIDEGFSSLDKSLLEAVNLVLESVRSQKDKLVGLISHIDDVKSFVPQYLYVKRDRTGSSRIY
jgi:exonuclease SbcC